MRKTRRITKSTNCLVADCPGANNDDVQLYIIQESDKKAWCAKLKINPSHFHTKNRVCSRHIDELWLGSKNLKTGAKDGNETKYEHNPTNSQKNDSKSFASEEELMDISSMKAEEPSATDIFADSFAVGPNTEQPFKNIATQTGLNETRTCAYVTATENLSAFNVNCCFCDATYSVKDWDKFSVHFECKHRHEPESLFEFEMTERRKKSGSVNLKSEIWLTDVNGDELNIADDDNNVHQTNFSPLHDDGDSNNFNETFDKPADEDSDTNDFEKIIKDARVNRKKAYRKTNLNELNVETADAAQICGLIDFIASHPVLWFFQLYRSDIYTQTFRQILKEFNKKFELSLRDKDMHWSIQKLGTWYQEICEKEHVADKLSYPQREYFEKLSKFMPDKPNGISCTLCQRLMPDHLQYLAHKQLKHLQFITASDIDDVNTTTTFMGIHKSELNNYLDARYPKKHGGSYICEVCSHDCHRRNYYFEHIKKHLNIRDLVCDICGNNFTNEGNLSKHKRRHLGELKCVCKVCNKVCNDNQLLRLHLRRYHRPIEGTIEEIETNLAKYPKKSKFTTYLDANTQTPYYICDLCEQVYADYNEINEHIKTMHEYYCPTKAVSKRPSNESADKPKKKIARIIKIPNSQHGWKRPK